MLGCGAKVIVGAEHKKIVPQAKLNQDRIDRADLHAVTATHFADFGCPDVIITVGL